jgi:hypothetical protein
MARDDNGILIRAPAITFLVVSPLVVALRFWARRLERSGFRADDWVILASLVR